MSCTDRNGTLRINLIIIYYKKACEGVIILMCLLLDSIEKGNKTLFFCTKCEILSGKNQQNSWVNHFMHRCSSKDMEV